jgi:hypothetical protein
MSPTQTDLTSPFWGEADLISVYTREDAIRDGSLVDVSETDREAGFTLPVAVTRGRGQDRRYPVCVAPRGRGGPVLVVLLSWDHKGKLYILMETT